MAGLRGRYRGRHGAQPGRHAASNRYAPLYDPSYRAKGGDALLPAGSVFEDDPDAVADKGSPGRGIVAGIGRRQR
jgi:hypothetical protein